MKESSLSAPADESQAARLLRDRLPAGIVSRRLDNGNGLGVHVLTAGDDDPRRPLALLLHGFPEIGFSWRRMMLPLAQAGWFVVAPDQRGYGLTQGSDDRFDSPLERFGILNLVRDQLGLLRALGRERVDLLVGHDFGSPVAAWCTLIRPDVFASVALMSAPFGGPPDWPAPDGTSRISGIDHAALAALARPRKHYQWYYSTPHANADMMSSAAGVHGFLRDYYHAKSADWAGNSPCRLNSWAADELARMPDYYIMGLADTMPEAVAPARPSTREVEQCTWLPDADLAVYSAIYEARGFQGGLQWYRCATGTVQRDQLRLFAGMTIRQPACFIAGTGDWGVWQKPGEFDLMARRACTDFRGAHLIEGAGHWVQQEQPDRTVAHLLDFAGASRGR